MTATIIIAWIVVSLFTLGMADIFLGRDITVSDFFVALLAWIIILPISLVIFLYVAGQKFSIWLGLEK